MCSLTEDVMYENLSNLKIINYKICKKCHASDPVIVLRKIDVYCKNCFLTTTSHKFRLMLGKYRIVRPNDQVLINYRIGHPSTALVQFLHEGLHLVHHKKFRFKPIFLYIEENYKLNTSDRKQLLQNIYEQFSTYNFTIYFASLNSYMNNVNNCTIYNYIEFIDYIEKTREAIHCKLQNNPQNFEAIDIYRRNLLTHASKKLNCMVVFTPEICVDTAVGILSNIALGRGAQIPLNVGVIDDRDEQIKIFRPLRLFEIKELVYYNHLNNLNPTSVRKIKFTDENALNMTVQTLMKNFVEGLQVNFPSTVATITRTGDKLSCDKRYNFCNVCNTTIEIQSDLSSSEATEFSKWISRQSSNNINEFIIPNEVKKYCFACSKIDLY